MLLHGMYRAQSILICETFSMKHMACFLFAGPDKPKHLRRHLQGAFDELRDLLDGAPAALIDPISGELRDCKVGVLVGGDRAFLQSVFGLNHQQDFCPLCDQLAPSCQKTPSWGTGGPNRKRAMLALYKLEHDTTLR